MVLMLFAATVAAAGIDPTTWGPALVVVLLAGRWPWLAMLGFAAGLAAIVIFCLIPIIGPRPYIYVLAFIAATVLWTAIFRGLWSLWAGYQRT